MRGVVVEGYEYETILLAVFVAAVVFNVVYYRSNTVFLFVSVGVVLVYYYGSTVTNIKATSIKKEKTKERLQRLVETFEPTVFDTAAFDVFELPKRFRYLFIKPDMWEALYNIKFTRSLDDASFKKVFAVLETFLKLFYESIKTKQNMKNALETMKQMHEMIKELRNDLVFNVSPSAKRAKQMINTSFVSIEEVMVKKIKMIQALVDGKIK